MEKDSIQLAREGFEDSFKEPSFYNRQTQDSRHLQLLLDTANLQSGTHVLDLGTGNGYVAFAVAKAYPAVQVTGIDIVAETLARNSQKALEEGLQNIDFIPYAGVDIPFPDGAFDCIFCRYAFHHFPDAARSFSEMARVLSPTGRILLADPTPHPLDADRFVDAYMKVKPDGHNKFYTLAEFEALAAEAGLVLQNHFVTQIRFPRRMEAAYTDLLAAHSQEVQSFYAVQILEDECFITEDVLNMFFGKSTSSR